MARAVDGDVLNMYGPTETTVWSTVAPIDRSGGPITIGRPIANTQVYIVDRYLRPVPIGVAGELLIGGDGVTRGYLNGPTLRTNGSFLIRSARTPGCRLYRTGDLVRYREDGQIEFLGRLDHQVKIRGYRIELGEIESVLSGHPAVRECVVVAPRTAAGDRNLVAYVGAGSARVVRRRCGDPLAYGLGRNLWGATSRAKRSRPTRLSIRPAGSAATPAN